MLLCKSCVQTILILLLAGSPANNNSIIVLFPVFCKKSTKEHLKVCLHHTVVNKYGSHSCYGRAPYIFWMLLKALVSISHSYNMSKVSFLSLSQSSCKVLAIIHYDVDKESNHILHVEGIFLIVFLDKDWPSASHRRAT